MTLRLALYWQLPQNCSKIHNSRCTRKDDKRVTILPLSLWYPRVVGYLMVQYPRSVGCQTMRCPTTVAYRTISTSRPNQKRIFTTNSELYFIFIVSTCGVLELGFLLYFSIIQSSSISVITRGIWALSSLITLSHRRLLAFSIKKL